MNQCRDATNCREAMEGSICSRSLEKILRKITSSANFRLTPGLGDDKFLLPLLLVMSLLDISKGPSLQVEGLKSTSASAGSLGQADEESVVVAQFVSTKNTSRAWWCACSLGWELRQFAGRLEITCCLSPGQLSVSRSQHPMALAVFGVSASHALLPNHEVSASSSLPAGLILCRNFQPCTVLGEQRFLYFASS